MSGRNLGVLISGRGSNLQALIDAIADKRLDASIAVVISNRAGAEGLQRARNAGIPALTLSPKGYADRNAYDEALAATLREHAVDVVCLAGYMRLVGRPILDAFPSCVLNVHPSLLPAFPGLDAAQQAWAHGVRVSGATVHLVTEGLDDGPIIVQAAVPVMPDDTPASLAARILVEEHRLYPQAVQMVLDGGWTVEGRRFVRSRD